jgi:uncharacterized protein (DUF2267 family)
MARTPTIELLQATIQKTDDWLTELGEHTGGADPEKAWHMFRGVLHVLRDRVPADQCAHLSAQLPLVIRGLYFEGWKPADQPVRLRSAEEFVQAVAAELSGHPELDADQAVRGVFAVLAGRLTAGEREKIKSMLQPDIQALWPAG